MLGVGSEVLGNTSASGRGAGCAGGCLPMTGLDGVTPGLLPSERVFREIAGAFGAVREICDDGVPRTVDGTMDPPRAAPVPAGLIPSLLASISPLRRSSCCRLMICVGGAGACC